jgi:hypothetical protein
MDFRRKPSGNSPFPTETRRKCQEFGNRMRLSVLTDSCRFRAEADKSVYRNTASMKSREYHGMAVSVPDCSTWVVKTTFKNSEIFCSLVYLRPWCG